MDKLKTTIILFLLLLFLYSCGGVSDVGKVLRNEKTRTTDEFLVKKREPLSLPPEYNTLPEPNSKIENKMESDIDKIFKIPKDKNDSKGNISSVEQSIINEIRK